MTERELRRLSRADLLELLLETTRENEELRQRLEQASVALADKVIRIESVGSIAEAALQLNRVFEAAQAACDQYSLNIHQRCDEQRRRTQEECVRMLEQARQQLEEVEAGHE